jgi:hypothetical protein
MIWEILGAYEHKDGDIGAREDVVERSISREDKRSSG